MRQSQSRLRHARLNGDGSVIRGAPAFGGGRLGTWDHVCPDGLGDFRCWPRGDLPVPDEQRRSELEQLMPADPSWQAPAYHGGDGADLLKASAQQGLEGIVAKRLRSCYEPGRRTGDWLKIKNWLRRESVIGGWLEGKPPFRSFFGAHAVGYYDVKGCVPVRRPRRRWREVDGPSRAPGTTRASGRRQQSASRPAARRTRGSLRS
ncbi:hypothetical protein [Jiangella sp. DSM 45060]|uniref:ATP-dependent DNA ligase n=1 Tax=Jiangella sp. DSM 45060 TaxID=1798224 RepID=UPI000B8480E9